MLYPTSLHIYDYMAFLTLWLMLMLQSKQDATNTHFEVFGVTKPRNNLPSN